MQLFYQPDISPEDQEVYFPAAESKHIIKVLRKKKGDTLFLTNGKGGFFTTEILVENQKKCVAVIKSAEQEPEPDYHLHLAVAPTKMNSRYEWFLEKATEIGISEITPIICDHSERTTIRIERFEKVLQSAMKQSLQKRLPILHEAVSFADFMKNDIGTKKFIAHCEEGKEKQLFGRQQIRGENCTVLIGPEGDFSSEEIKKAIENNWIPVSLGNNRLRTETAAIVACHTVALVNEK